MIRRRDGDWLPFWRLTTWDHQDLGWTVSVEWTGTDGRPRIDAAVPSRTRLGALWNGLRNKVRERPEYMS